MPDFERLLGRSSDLAFVESEDRVSLLDLRALDRPPLVLEGTAIDVWQRLDGSLTLEELVAELAHEYAAPLNEVEAGVVSFLVTLGELDLLDDADDGSVDD